MKEKERNRLRTTLDNHGWPSEHLWPLVARIVNAAVRREKRRRAKRERKGATKQ